MFTVVNSPQEVKIMVQNKVKECREAAGLTQEELSKKAGISRTMISKLETDKKADCKVSTMLAIARVLERPLSEIFLV